MKKTCIIITGPTAVGKTAIALSLARHFKTQIISADSRQCFKELNIAVAKPGKTELDSVFHYFINSHSIQDYISAADFEEYALTAVEEIFRKNDIAIMVVSIIISFNSINKQVEGTKVKTWILKFSQ